MKRIILLMTMVIVGFTGAYAQWTENFEGGALPSGWLVETLDTNGGFIVGDAATFANGTGYNPTDHTLFLAVDEDNCNCDNMLTRVITSDIDLTGLVNPLLSFEAFYGGQTYLTITETATVQVSSDGGATWGFLGVFNTDIPNWKNTTLSLGGYSGTIRLAFDYSDGGGWLYGAAIDDIQVISTPDVMVTFQVNMANETVSANGVHIAGSFQGWDPAASEMTDPDGDGIYTFSAIVAGASSIQYKFVNGNAWGSDEGVPGDCGVDNGFGGFNRFVNTAVADITTDLVCYAQCTNCNDGNSCEGATVAYEGVNTCADLTGASATHGDATLARWFSFTAPSTGVVAVASCDGGVDSRVWLHSGACGALSEITGNDDYCDTGGGLNYASQANMAVTAGETYLIEWDDRWSTSPFTFTITYGGELASVTYSVDMTGQTVDPAGVFIFGATIPNNAVPMADAGNNIWTVTVGNELVGGTVYYLFVNGDPAVVNPEDAITDCGGTYPGYNGDFRTAEITSANQVLETVCYNVCGPCSLVATRAITFVCDMAAVVANGGTVSPDGIHLAGSLQSEAGFAADWDPTSTLLTNVAGTDKWSITLNVPDGVYEYKYINGMAWGNNENLDGPCEAGTSTNRALNVTADATEEFCYNYCYSCQQVIGTNDISFDAAITIVPNPASTVAKVSFNFGQAANLQIRLVNQLGQVVSTQNTAAQNGSINLDLTTVPAGVYFVQLTDGQNNTTKRLVVQK